MCQNVEKNVKCQKYVKCQKVKQLDYGEVSPKNDIMRFTHIDVSFDITYDIHQNWSKILPMNILKVFGDHHT